MDTKDESLDRAALVDRTVDQMRQIMRVVRSSADEDWTTLSLTRAQLRILARLAREGPAAVGQLAAQFKVTLPSITATIDRLVQQGLVTREDDPNDRRRVINRLTPAGSQLIDHLREGRRARLLAAMEQLTSEELVTLAGALTSLHRHLPDPTSTTNSLASGDEIGS